MSSLVIRTPEPSDVAGLADLLVQAWNKAYRGLIPDTVLDDPHAWSRRHRMWSIMLAEADPERRIALAERSGKIVGVGVSQPSEEDPKIRSLSILYVLANEYGTGTGQVLFDAVIYPDEPSDLWVAEPNPRAQAFYRKNGFVDGKTRTSEHWGIKEKQMMRLATASS
ncbi:GNAT family N-acetyltransferase [Actinomycetaceae bacterium MB13-C1-2]|nr:GNAT family N-acetyltransferase [Actinomycetaceae bacterium MB13-C1-2]